MFFIDVQGTLIDDRAQQLLTGSAAFIARLNRDTLSYLVVTTTRSVPVTSGCGQPWYRGCEAKKRR